MKLHFHVCRYKIPHQPLLAAAVSLYAADDCVIGLKTAKQLRLRDLPPLPSKDGPNEPASGKNTPKKPRSSGTLNICGVHVVLRFVLARSWPQCLCVDVVPVPFSGKSEDLGAAITPGAGVARRRSVERPTPDSANISVSSSGSRPSPLPIPARSALVCTPCFFFWLRISTFPHAHQSTFCAGIRKNSRPSHHRRHQM